MGYPFFLYSSAKAFTDLSQQQTLLLVISTPQQNYPQAQALFMHHRPLVPVLLRMFVP